MQIWDQRDHSWRDLPEAQDGHGISKAFFTQSTFGVECDGAVRFVPRTGGPVTDVAQDICHLIGLAADATAIYWSEFDSATQTGRIMKMSAPYTGTPTVLDTVSIRT